MQKDMSEQLNRIRMAYDASVEEYHKGIDPFENVPEEFKNSPGFKAFIEDSEPTLTAAAAPDIKKYLDPKPGMRFLDAGCGGSLAEYRLDKWPSIYYGVDISPALIRAMEKFVSCKDISIGGLWVADVANLPFNDNFFDIASMIGVLEYYPLEYCESSLLELHRVLKAQARMVLDIPNLEHPRVNIMFQLEEYLERPNIPKSRSAFERILTSLFTIERTDDSRVMLKYCVRSSKMRMD